MATRKKPAAEGAVQGEGDYASARKYNQRTREFVARQGDAPPPPSKAGRATRAELAAAEKAALARSKGRAGDQADAKSMAAKEKAGARRARPASSSRPAR